MKISPAVVLALLSAGSCSARHVKRSTFGGQSKNGDACIAAQALAAGVQSNIDLQRGEESSLARVKNIVSQPAVDANAFKAAKQQLLDFVAASVAVRGNNQLIAPEDNPASAGLNIVRIYLTG